MSTRDEPNTSPTTGQKSPNTSSTDALGLPPDSPGTKRPFLALARKAKGSPDEPQHWESAGSNRVDEAKYRALKQRLKVERIKSARFAQLLLGLGDPTSSTADGAPSASSASSSSSPAQGDNAVSAMHTIFQSLPLRSQQFESGRFVIRNSSRTSATVSQAAFNDWKREQPNHPLLSLLLRSAKSHSSKPLPPLTSDMRGLVSQEV